MKGSVEQTMNLKNVGLFREEWGVHDLSKAQHWEDLADLVGLWGGKDPGWSYQKVPGGGKRLDSRKSRFGSAWKILDSYNKTGKSFNLVLKTRKSSVWGVTRSCIFERSCWHRYGEGLQTFETEGWEITYENTAMVPAETNETTM